MRTVKFLAFSSLLLVPAAGFAGSDVESGDLTLAKAAPKAEFIIDGADWQCVDIICHAAWVDDMPPVRQCQRVVLETGAVTAFSYRGKALNAAQLAQCNTWARS